jgi:hypothetical protein
VELLVVLLEIQVEQLLVQVVFLVQDMLEEEVAVQVEQVKMDNHQQQTQLLEEMVDLEQLLLSRE